MHGHMLRVALNREYTVNFFLLYEEYRILCECAHMYVLNQISTTVTS